jgi:hypothetical protein
MTKTVKLMNQEIRKRKQSHSGNSQASLVEPRDGKAEEE